MATVLLATHISHQQLGPWRQGTLSIIWAHYLASKFSRYPFFNDCLIWEFPNLVVSNLVFAIFTRKRSFALFCGRALLPSFACICVFLSPTAFRTTAFGNCRVINSEILNCCIVTWDWKNHDSHRRDRILRFFLRPKIGRFSPYFGVISSLNYTEHLEKREKIRWRKFKNLVETAPRDCRFLSFVVVERALSNCNVILIRINSKKLRQCNCNVTVIFLIPRAPVIVSRRFGDYVGLGIT